MIQAQLFFGLNLDFDLTTNEALQKSSTLKVWDKGLQTYLYIFNVKELPNVLALTGNVIQIDVQQLGILNKHYPMITETKTLEPYKGKGYVNIVSRGPQVYIIEFPMRKKPAIVKIPTESVNTTWKVIQKYPIGGKVPTRVIAQNYCKELNINRFNRPTSNSWDFSKFSGTRIIYLKFWGTLKVLQIDGVINYLKVGKVIRLKDVWEQQNALR